MTIAATDDPCMSVWMGHEDPDPRGVLRFLQGYLGVAPTTPRDRIAHAVAVELQHRVHLALQDLESIDDSVPGRSTAAAILSAATEHNDACLANPKDVGALARARFPRAELQALQCEVPSPLRELLEGALARHERLQARLSWLIRGTPAEVIETLDPKRDHDQIHNFVSRAFRVESRILELLMINRIAQSEVVSMFFRSTGEAAGNPVKRFYDTFNLYANWMEWDPESLRGRAGVDRMNEIHGRYYIPNDGMKYVLLVGIFTWIEGLDRIGHRPMTRVEKLGWFHAYIEMGRAMNIHELTDDFDEMQAWFDAFNRANITHSALKTETFELIVDNSLEPLEVPGAREDVYAACVAAMTDDYRRALGYPEPTELHRERVRAVFYTLGSVANRLPTTAFVRTLHSNPARKHATPAGQLGVSARSPHLPTISTTDGPRENGGYPYGQHPVHHKTPAEPMALPSISADELARHTSEDSCWIALHGEVYDVTSMLKVHPGGKKAIMAWAGRDATKGYERAKHSAATEVFKLNYRIGVLEP